MCIDTRDKHTDIIGSLGKFSNLWTFFCTLWLLNSNLSELHINLELFEICVIETLIFLPNELGSTRTYFYTLHVGVYWWSLVKYRRIKLQTINRGVFSHLLANVKCCVYTKSVKYLQWQFYNCYDKKWHQSLNSSIMLCKG